MIQTLKQINQAERERKNPTEVYMKYIIYQTSQPPVTRCKFQWYAFSSIYKRECILLKITITTTGTLHLPFSQIKARQMELWEVKTTLVRYIKL